MIWVAFGNMDDSEKFDKDFVDNASYVERAISYYFKEKMFEGLLTLKSKRFIFFFLYLVLVLFAAIASVLMTTPEINILTIDQAKKFVMLGIVTAFVFIVGGFISGFFGETMKNVIIVLLSGLSIYYCFFMEYDYNWIFWQWVKVAYFVIWASFSSISGFFFVVYFFTSLPGRILTIGKSKSHVFLGLILKLLIFGCIPAFIYLFLMGTPDAKLIGIVGVLVSVLAFVSMYALPNKNSDEHDGGTNFAQILGFYYFLILGQLVSAFGSSGTTVDLIKELALLCILGLFMINSLSGRVKNIKAYEEIQKEKMKYQKKITIFPKLKEKWGDKSLIFMALGIALGYLMFVLDSFLRSPLVLLDSLMTEGMRASTIYTRLYLFIALMVVLLSCILYASSSKFRDFVRNFYTFKDTWVLFKGLFTKGEDGEPSVVQQEIKAGAEKIKETVRQATKGFLSGFMGKKPKDSPESNQNQEKKK